jgi:hypothetical protein
MKPHAAGACPDIDDDQDNINNMYKNIIQLASK